MKKIGRRFLALLAACVFLTAAAVPAAADDVGQEASGYAVQIVESFLSTVYQADMSELAVMEDTGDFYQVFYDSWKEDSGTVGAFREIVSTDVEEGSDGQLVTTSLVRFENYDAEAVLYLDAKTLDPINYEFNIQYSIGEKVSQAAQNMAVGLIVVFILLITLTVVISLFGVFKRTGKKSTTAEAEAPAAAPAAAKAAAPAPAVQPAAADEDDEIAAVIAAAIAAAEADQPSASGYVVRSVRRTGGSWKRTQVMEQ